ncbi:MAG: HAD family hydrolase [Candidatus Baltobacteraceae bacterium]
MPEFRAVLFDLDDTLHDDTLAFTTAAQDVAHEVAAEHGIDALALKKAYIAEAEGFWHRLSGEQVRTRMTHLRETLWANALGAVGLSDPALAQTSASNYYSYRQKRYELFPGALDLLRGLKARGIKIGLVTNGFSETHRDKLAVLQIAEYFDALFLPDETGLVKPDPMLFAQACRRLGVAPAHSVMVGDRYDRDITGAAQAGLYTIWVNVRADALPPGAAVPDVTVERIGQVAAHLLGSS